MRQPARQLAYAPAAHPAAAPALALPSPPAAFRWVLGFFAMVSVARISDIVPFLAAVPIGKLLGAVMIVFAAVWLPRHQVAAGMRNTTVRAVAAIAVLALLSVPTSVWRGNSVAFIQAKLLPNFVFFFIASLAFADRRTARTTIALLVVTVAAGAVRLLVAPVVDFQGRASFGTLDPNDTAALMVATIPFAMLLASERGPGRPLLYAVPVLCVLALVKTGSRGGLLGLVAVGLMLIYLATPRRRLTYVAAIAVGGAVFAGAATGALRERFATVLNMEGDYNLKDREGRIEIWKRGIGYMVDNPVLGVGIGGFETAEGTLSGKKNIGFGLKYTASHNAFIQIGAELGVGGLAALVTAIAAAGWGCWRVRRNALAARASQPETSDREAALAGTALASLFGVMTTALFLSFAYHPIPYFVLAICCGVVIGAAIAASHAAPGVEPAAGAPALAAPAAAYGWRSARSRHYGRA